MARRGGHRPRPYLIAMPEKDGKTVRGRGQCPAPTGANNYQYMGYDPDLHHRHAMRQGGCDYREAGWYFVTQCVAQRQPLFGQVQEGVMYLSPCGMMVQEALLKSPTIYGIGLDCFTIMPDHFHAIFQLKGMAGRAAILDSDQGGECAPPLLSLFDVMRRLKTFTATQYRHHAQRGEWAWLESGLWQRSYYDRIIRTECELENVRRYILENLQRWATQSP